MEENIRIAGELIRIAKSLVADGKIFQNAKLHTHISELDGLIIQCEMWSGDVFHGKQAIKDYDAAKREFNEILASVSRAIKSATNYKAEVRQNNKGTMGWFFYVKFEGQPSDYEKCKKAVENVLRKNYDVG